MQKLRYSVVTSVRLYHNFSKTVMAEYTGSTVSISDEYDEILEGKARIRFPKGQVFYNPVQVFNRDLSVAVIDHYSKHFWNPTKRFRQRGPYWKNEEGKFEEEKEAMETETSGADQKDPNEKEEDRSNMAGNQRDASKSTERERDASLDPRKSDNSLCILDALSASGLRSLRYALEVPLAGRITANDISEDAYRSICSNISVNRVGDKVSPSLKDASILMYECKSQPTDRYDIVDIDPYGSPTSFLDSAVQACHDGGLLCVTCTDTSILCGNHSETCHAKYGSMSIKAKYSHEMALRIILACIESHANRYRRYILPLLSCSIDFYCRVFVLVYTSAYEVKRAASKLAMVYHCNGCGTFHLQPLGRVDQGKKGGLKFSNAPGPPVAKQCDHCGSTFKFGGPIWADPIHDVEFLKGLLKSAKESPNEYKTLDRIEGLVTMASEELPDVPLYHVLDELCSVLHCNSIKMAALRSAILDQGYSVSLSHSHPNAVKTNAPHCVVWDIMRCWVKQNPVKNLQADSPAARILQQEPKLVASFKIRRDAFPPSKVLKLARFPENPEPNWGPKARAKRKLDEDGEGKDLKRKSKELPHITTNQIVSAEENNEK